MAGPIGSVGIRVLSFRHRLPPARWAHRSLHVSYLAQPVRLDCSPGRRYNAAGPHRGTAEAALVGRAIAARPARVGLELIADRLADTPLGDSAAHPAVA